MAVKLYPPIINGTIPAFCGTTIVVPFSMNRAVSRSEVSGFKLQIKDVLGNILGVFEDTKNYDKDFSRAIFNCNIDFNIGSYYKLQLAYMGTDGTVGYYSTVGVAKYTNKPEIFIEGMKTGALNPHTYNYVGVFRQEGSNKDMTEKMYSSRLVIKENSRNEIVYDSGEVLHNITEDSSPYEQKESFLFSRDLDDALIYSARFYVKTTNNLILKSGDEYIGSPKYKITQQRSIPSAFDFSLNAELDFDEAFIKLTFSSESEENIGGKFVISRAASNNNFYWEKLKTCSFGNLNPSDFELRDYLIEQGVTYKYSIQQSNGSNLLSQRICSEEIYADYEDAFLYDGKTQLKIRYNPKVSTYKLNVQDAKVDTIGSKYPFIFRGAYTHYKEFAISGLISYQSDPAELFMAKQDLGLKQKVLSKDYYVNNDTEKLQEYLLNIKKASEAENDENREMFLAIAAAAKAEHEKRAEKKTLTEVLYEKQNDLTNINIAAERIFKNNVLEWLNNGGTKIFKTPSEGIYLVRLMNCSMTPTDSLGRMLHTFSATAYEIGEYSLDVFLKDDEDLITQGVEKIGFKNVVLQNDEEYFISTASLSSIKLSDFLPGTRVTLQKDSGETEEILIGATGTYKANNIDGINSIIIKGYAVGSVEYVAEIIKNTTFDLISGVVTYEVPIKQYIGSYYKDLDYVHGTGIYFDESVPSREVFETLPREERLAYIESHKSDNLLDYIENTKESFYKFYFCRFEKRPLLDAFIDYKDSELETQLFTPDKFNGIFYDTMECKNKINNLIPTCIYLLRTKRSNYTYKYIRNSGYYPQAMQADFSHYLFDEDGKIYVYDAYKEEIMAVDLKDLFVVEIDGIGIDLTEIEKLDLSNVTSEDYMPKSIIPNMGVISELSFSKQEKTYGVEQDEDMLMLYKSGDMNEYMTTLIDKIIEYKEANEIE